MINKNKILFLDIDGVLISQEYSKLMYNKYGPSQSWKRFDPKAITILSDIVSSTNCKIVISSAWRIGRSVEELQNIFRKQNFKFYDNIISKTTSISMPVSRGKEITTWIENNINDIYSYAILDDEDYDLKNHVSRLIQTNFTYGLLDCHKQKVINLLNKKINLNDIS